MPRYIFKDPDGIPRGWGDGPTDDIAETRCREALLEYAAHRRQWPVDAYTIEKDKTDSE